MTEVPDYQFAMERASRAKDFIQGEVLDLQDACVVLADPGFPLSAQSNELKTKDAPMVAVPWHVEHVVLITQTCDLQTTDANNFLCQVAPVIEMEEVFAYQAQRGRRPGFAALPWFSNTAVADLSKITSLERSLLVGRSSLGRPEDARARLHFAEAVSRHFTRVALPDPIYEAIDPFLSRMREKHDRDSSEGKCISLIADLRIEVRPDLDSERPDLKILIVLEADDLPLIEPDIELDYSQIDMLKQLDFSAIASEILNGDSKHIREAWTALAEKWIEASDQKAENSMAIGSLEVEVVSGDELSFTRLRNAPQLDLAYLSTRSALRNKIQSPD